MFWKQRYAPYAYLYLIYCLTHVKCFRFFLAANIAAAPKLQTTRALRSTSYKQRLWRLCLPYGKSEVGFLGHVTHVTGEITRFQSLNKFAASFGPAFYRLATRSRKSATRFLTRFAAGYNNGI